MSDVLRVGIIGAGWITRAHGLAIRTLPHLDPLGRPVRITMLAARGRERGEAMARHLEVERFTTDWRELVEDPSVDVVANATAVTGHREATEAALALGKPVLCEKPLGVDRFEAGSMLAAARVAGVQAVTGFNYRYVPAMRLAREIVLSGALGTIVQFRATYLQDYAAVASRLQPPNGSRAVSDYGHILDFLRYLGCAAAGRPGDEREADRPPGRTSKTPTSRRSTSSAAASARSRRPGSPAAGRAARSSRSTAPPGPSGGTWRT